MSHLNAAGIVCGESFFEAKRRLEHTPLGEAWKRVEARDHHGISVSLASLKSDTSNSGIGEFSDLFAVVDFLVNLKFDLLQLLPINDSSTNNPYKLRSSMALNPIYLSLSALPQFGKPTEAMTTILHKLESMERSHHFVNWNQVAGLKSRYMDQYLSLPEVESAIVQSESFTNWVNNNESWLESHALFSVFQAQYCCDWEQWPVNLRDLYAQVGGEFRPPNVSSFDEDVQKRVLRYKFTQWLCHQQLLSVAIYARSNGISLICDMPNIPNRVSADVWINRQLFDENYSVGTPPDVFNPVGHSWKYGIKYPTINWEQRQAEGIKFWKGRISRMSQYFDIFRIEKIRFFFRSWNFPRGWTPDKGHWVPDDINAALKQGDAILKAIIQDFPSKLIFGDTSPNTPKEFLRALQQLGICGSRIMRWERMMGEKDQPFISPKDFNSDCVCSVSTECIDPLCVWWTTSPNHVVEYCQWKHWTEPVGDKLPKNRLAAMLHDSHRASCIFHINPLVEYLSLNEAYIHEDYQQNRTRASGPDDILGDDSSWRYRMIPSLQTIAQDQRLLEDIRSTLEADENDYEAFKGFS